MTKKIFSYDYDRIYGNAEIELEFVTETPLLIKSGEKEDILSERNQPRFMREMDSEGNMIFIVPGSTMKGFFRATLERLPEMNLKETNKVFGYTKTNLKKDYGFTLQDLSQSGWSAPESKGSNFFFSDFIARDCTVELRTQIAVQQDFQVVKSGALVTLEAVSRGNIFTGKITIRNWTIEAFKTIALVMKMAELGFVRIGSNKSRGFGHIKFRIRKIALQVIGSKNDVYSVSTKNNQITIEESFNTRSHKIALECNGDDNFQEEKRGKDIFSYHIFTLKGDLAKNFLDKCLNA